MGLLRETLDRLKQGGFAKESSEKLNEVQAFCYRKDHQIVVVKNYESDMDSEDIIEDTAKARTCLLGSGFNVWNTYYLIICQYKIDGESSYVIERDSRLLRKYLIKNINDFDRICFMDQNRSELGHSPILSEELFSPSDGNLSTVIRFLKENGGENGSVKQDKILTELKKILSLGEEYEINRVEN